MRFPGPQSASRLLNRIAACIAIAGCATTIGIASAADGSGNSPNVYVDRSAAPIDETGPGFEHIEAQKREVASANVSASTALSEATSGAISLAEKSPENDLRRTTTFDPIDGELGFSSSLDGDVSRVTIHPEGRDEPDTVASSLGAVTAEGVEAGADEVTLATDAGAEQHLIVDESTAKTRVVKVYRIDMPADARAFTYGGRIVIDQGVRRLLTIAADYAKDEAGTSYPVELQLGEDKRSFSVTFDGRELTPEGRVAIDPRYDNSPGTGFYDWQLCQAATYTEACRNESSVIPAQLEFFTNDSDFKLAANPTWGTYVSTGPAGSTIVGGGIAYWLFRAPAGVTIAQSSGFAEAFEINRDYFGCRPALMNGAATPVAVVIPPGGWTDGPNGGGEQQFSLSLDSPADDAKGFAIQLANRAGGSVTTVEPDEARCWMSQTEAAGGMQRSIVTLRFKDAGDPVPSSRDNTAVPGAITSTNNDPPTSIDYATMRWYKSGEGGDIPLVATDGGSGVQYVGPIFTANGTPSPARTATVCTPNALMDATPCPVAPADTSASVVFSYGEGTVTREGSNGYRVFAQDYAGNQGRSAPLYFLFDSRPPYLPVPRTGDGVGPGPVLDQADDVPVFWDPASDPGSELPQPEGSGVGSLQGIIERRTGPLPTDWTAGVDAASNGIMNTSPGTGGALPNSDSFDARPGQFRYRLSATDRAGNNGGWTFNRYFRVDTTPPKILLDTPTGQLFQMRTPAEAPALKFTVSDDYGDDPIDEIGIDTRPVSAGGSGAWTSAATETNAAQGARIVTPSIPANGRWTVRGFARDGAMDAALSNTAEVCADVSLNPADLAAKPQRVDVMTEVVPGKNLWKSARLRVTVQPRVARAGVKIWLIQRRSKSGEAWKVVGQEPASNLTTFTFDDTSQALTSTEWQVSPATQVCTTKEIPSLATLATPQPPDQDFIDSKPEQVNAQQLLGLERFWTFHELPLGGGATAYTNASVGNLVVTRPLLSEQHPGGSTDVDLTYNSQVRDSGDPLARNGSVGSHWNLAIDRFAAPYATMIVSSAGATVADGDGTRHAFVRSGANYMAPPGIRMSLRNIVKVNEADDKVGVARADGSKLVVHHKLSDADGTTYYFARDVSKPVEGPGVASHTERLIARKDADGHLTRYVYDCVAITVGASGAHTFSTLATDAIGCPGADGHLRLSRVESPGFNSAGDPSGSGGLRVDLEYSPDGHLAAVTGHGPTGARRSTRLTYGTAQSALGPDADPTDQLVEITDVARDLEERTTKLGYTGAFDDPTSWFDKNSLLDTVGDFRNNVSRFRYGVPDLRNRTTSNPRVTEIRNREDSATNDGRGDGRAIHVTYDVQSDGPGMGTLAGATSFDDQLDRRTIYRWQADRAAANFGVVSSVREPAGVTNALEWSSQLQLTSITKRAPFIVAEPVILVGNSWSVLRGGAIDTSFNYAVSEGQVAVDFGRGLIRSTAAVAPLTQRKVRVTYQPARTIELTNEYDSVSGALTASTDDQRAPLTPKPGWDVDHPGRPRTSITYQAGKAANGAVNYDARAQQLFVVPQSSVSPRGHVTSYAYEEATGRLASETSPVVPGAVRAVSGTTYDGNGNITSVTSEVNETLSLVTRYSGHDLGGHPRFVSRPARPGTDRGLAYELRYDADGQVTCILDMRGQSGYGNRYATFQYDSFGRLVSETSPWRTANGLRYRRKAFYSLDGNGNTVRTVRNVVYVVAETLTADADCADTGGLADAKSGTAVPWEKPDTTFDALDRPIEKFALPNTDVRGNPGDTEAWKVTRKSTTEYNRAGDIVREITAQGNRTGDGGDYEVEHVYDRFGREVETIDGIRRHTCSYPDPFGNPVIVVAAGEQGTSDCREATPQGLATVSVFDNAGRAVWTRSPSGQIATEERDADGNAVESRVLDIARSGGDLFVRRTQRTFGADDLLVSETAPARTVCPHSVWACVPKELNTTSPTRRSAYDGLGRVIANYGPRSSYEQVRDTTVMRFDFDGNQFREDRFNGDETTYTHTKFDAYGNPILVTQPTSAGALGSTTEAISTNFEYQDDDAPTRKDDVAHDNAVTWTYDRDGRVTSRSELGRGAKAWTSTQTFDYYADGSLRSKPAEAIPFESNRTYIRDMCVRSPADQFVANPKYLYVVEGSARRLRAAASKIEWNKWAEYGVKKTGDVRLRKVPAKRVEYTYDADGATTSITSCDTSVEWTKRDDIGQPLRIEDKRYGRTTFLYDQFGRERVMRPEGIRQYTTEYVDADINPDTYDAGAGKARRVSLESIKDGETYVDAGFSYSLGGSVLRQDRFARMGERKTGRMISSVFTSYDAAGQVTGIRAQRDPEGAAGVHTIFEQELIRDVAGNVRRMDEMTRLAAPVESKKAGHSTPKTVGSVRERVRLYKYDSLGRLAWDKRAGSLDPRSYTYDAHGRMSVVREVGCKSVKIKGRPDPCELDRYVYRSGDGVRGAMLPTQHDSKAVSKDALTRTKFQYGSGQTVGDAAGPPGQLVKSTTSDVSITDTKPAKVQLSRVADSTYEFSALNSLERTERLDYAVARKTCVKDAKKKSVCKDAFEIKHGPEAGKRFVVKGKRAGQRSGEIQARDALGRRLGLLTMQDQLYDSAIAETAATEMFYVGDAADPYAEMSDDEADPATRWLVRANGMLIGETRKDTTRYLQGDQQGSIVQLLDGSKAAPVRATFDYESWGKRAPDRQEDNDKPLGMASGALVERQWTDYGYTGMRQSSTGDTTNHHARDYDPQSRGWIQTDQYLDPWRDVALSLDPSTQNRHTYAGANPVGQVDKDGHCILGLPCPDQIESAIDAISGWLGGNSSSGESSSSSSSSSSGGSSGSSGASQPTSQPALKQQYATAQKVGAISSVTPLPTGHLITCAGGACRYGSQYWDDPSWSASRTQKSLKWMRRAKVAADAAHAAGPMSCTDSQAMMALCLATFVVPAAAEGAGALRSARAVARGINTVGKEAAAFHYTSDAAAAAILRDGLRPGSFATSAEGLTPMQAQINLALRPNRGLPSSTLRIDLDAMRAAGYEVPEFSQVGRNFNMPGGGTEVQFPFGVPPRYITGG